MGPFRPTGQAKLEEHWRLRLEEAAKRHKAAKAACAKGLEEFNTGLTLAPDGSEAIRRATLEENAARDEHMKILKAFSDLLLHGKIPPEESPSSTGRD